MVKRSKILSLSELAKLSVEQRQKGNRVVLAHGVFDVLHLGHLRHLGEAKTQGDLLFVTVTPDRWVNKGPDRPIFPVEMRVEMLAALDIVDHVAISESPTAVDVVELVQPDVYVKGREYADATKDVSGGMEAEQLAVECRGGRVHFTDDITFSSSTLINQHFNLYDTEVRAYLDQVRSTALNDDLRSLLDKVADYSVTLVGDTIIDEYQYVDPLGKSPKENMIATKYKDRELFAGGVIAAANHVAGFCREVNVVTVLGEDESFETFVRSELKSNVRLHPIMVAGRPTVRKCRFVDAGYLRKLFEVYTIDETPITGKDEAAVTAAVEATAPGADLVIVTDFGHGMITAPVVHALEANARFLAVNTQTNSANLGYNLITRYKRADYVCIDAPEARLAMGDKFTDLSTLIETRLSNAIDCPRLIVTQGKYGCTTYDQATGTHHIPSFTKTVVDTVGAGDAFLTVTAPLVAAGGRMEHIGFVGNAVGAIKVGIVGHRRSVEKAPLLKYITALLK